MTDRCRCELVERHPSKPGCYWCRICGSEWEPRWRSDPLRRLDLVQVKSGTWPPKNLVGISQ